LRRPVRNRFQLPGDAAAVSHAASSFGGLSRPGVHWRCSKV
jgi:hypothetical protein